MTRNEKYLFLFFLLSTLFFGSIFFSKKNISQAYCCMPSCTDPIEIQENEGSVMSCQSNSDHIDYNHNTCSEILKCQNVYNGSSMDDPNNNSGGGSEGLFSGGLVPCGRNHDDGNPSNGDETAPCTLCHLVVGVQRIIQWLMHLITYIAIAALVAAGIFYIVSAGNEKMLEMAKGYIKAILTGFAVALAGWVLVNYTLYLFSVTSQEGGFVRGLTSGQHWWEFYCDTTSDLGSRTGNIPSVGTGGTTGSGSGGGSGIGITNDVYSNDEAVKLLNEEGIQVTSSGNCSDYHRSNCTSLESIPKTTIDNLIRLRRETSCLFNVTGGTEVGHKTHGPGRPVVDISQKECLVDALSHPQKYNIVKICTTNQYRKLRYNCRNYNENAPHFHLVFSL